MITITRGLQTGVGLTARLEFGKVSTLPSLGSWTRESRPGDGSDSGLHPW